MAKKKAEEETTPPVHTAVIQPQRFGKGELKAYVEEAVSAGVTKPQDIVDWLKRVKGKDSNLSSVYQVTLALRKASGEETTPRGGKTPIQPTEPSMNDVLRVGEALSGKRRNDVEDAAELLISVGAELNMSLPFLLQTLEKLRDLRRVLG